MIADNLDIIRSTGATDYDIRDGKVRLWKYDTNPNDFGWKYAIVEAGQVGRWQRWPNSHPPMSVSRI